MSVALEQKWAELALQIPGYDPFVTAPEGCHFYATEAEHVVMFFAKALTHVKGAKGKTPFFLEPWQQAIVGNIFGWKYEDGSRRYREVFLFVPRKNGKTPLAAGIALYVLTNDPEPGIEAYSAAADRDQASLVYAHASGMVAQNPELSSRLKIYRTARSIVREDQHHSYRVISADANTKHGFNSHLVIIDETHAQPDRELVDVLTTSIGARTQPLIIHTTTSDYDRESICNEKYEYACKVRDGMIEDSGFLPVIYEAVEPKDAEVDWWTNPKVWRACNPNLGVSVSLEYFERECRRAKESPAYQNTFKRLHLNLRTSTDALWFDMANWDKCGVEEIDLDSLIGRPCYAGLDLASVSDLCAFVLYFPDDGHAVLPWFWVPVDAARVREEKSRVPYPAWVSQGFISTTPGNVTDYDKIRLDIDELGERFDIKEIAIDRWNSTQLQTQLMGDGFEIVPFGQGFASMAAPSKELERMILAGEMRHGNNPVLRWMASNVMAETDAAGNVKPSKKKSSEKIDGIVALTMALGRAMVREEDHGSVYDGRGVLTI